MKKGQVKLSFGMIFSIILIIAFLAFGFFAIKKFLEFQEDVQIQQFLQDFQDDVDKAWKSPQTSQQVSYNVPDKINAICFDSEDEFYNLQFSSENIISGEYIEHLNVDDLTEEENPFCFENVEGQVEFTIVKSYGENLVKVVE